MTEEAFIEHIWNHYKLHKRELVWRNTRDPYLILVSEMMLQQTQVSRVLIKYREFTSLFPDFKTLAKAPMTKVLAAWKGLGYSRRAYFLKQTAEIVMKEYKGIFPEDHDLMRRLPGIGQSTAGAISAFSFLKKQPFIETNIRAVFMHEFYSQKDAITDRELMAKIAKVLERVPAPKIKDFYYALYDYGADLKQKLGGKAKTALHQKSSHYKKQSKFEGSNRQLRSIILDFILVRSLAASRKDLNLKDITLYTEGLIEKDEIPFAWNEDTKALISTLLDDLAKKKQIKKIENDDGENIFKIM